MDQARLTLDPAKVVAPVRRRTFGSFVEHLGRAVYTGIYEPGHVTADARGFRGDVADLTRELGVGTVRYPGGNFVSGYRWEDGIGPVESRPRRLDLAWHTTETNQVGTDEFLTWAAANDVEPMMAVNLGTRGIQEALDILEYCNLKGGTALSDLRRADGYEDPHGVCLWCLGNEMDGPWQLGHKTAEEYGRLAAETARAMRMVDPEVELVACGSSSSGMPTFGAWERTVLEHTYELVDMISAHAYYEEVDGDLASFLASANDMDHFITTVAAIADEVGDAKGLDKRIGISFDEWNVWYMNRPDSREGVEDWPVAPPILEDVYTAADAVVVGSLLISLLRHSDRVHAANLAQLVNVIAPIKTEAGGPAWKQTTFHPFALTAAHARGQVLQTALASPRHDTSRFGEVATVDAVTTWDADARTGSVFVVNRSPDDAVRFEVDVALLGALESTSATIVFDDDLYAVNTQEDPERVTPKEVPVEIADGVITLTMPRASWARIGFTVA